MEMLINRVNGKVVICVLAVLAAFAGPAPVHAQNGPEVLTDANGYKYLKPYIDPSLKGTELVELRRRYNDALSLVRKVLEGQGTLADNKRAFDYFFLNMYFPKYTLTTDEALGDLPGERQKLLRDLENSTVPAVHKYACELILNQMKSIVQDNYHPVSRYNAMLVISSLNDVETARIGANRTTPEPMVAALPFIYEQFSKADTDGVKMAALLGLLRHLEWDNFRGPVGAPTPSIPGPTRDAIVQDLLALALQTEPPKGREPLGHEWFRRRAIEGLAHANYLKTDPAVAEGLQTLLKSETESIAMRCAAATAIGQLPLQAPANVEIKPTTVELGYLALVACDKELARVTAQRKEDEDRLTRLSSGGSYGGGSSAGGLGSDSPGYGGGGGGYPGGGPGASGPRSMPGGAGMMGGPGMRGKAGGPRIPGGGSADGADGGYGYGAATAADPKQYRFDLIRRRLRSQLYAVEVGLGGPDPHARTRPGETATGPARGMAALAKGKKAEEKYVGEVQALVKKIADAVENADTDVTELEKDIRKQMKPLETATRKLVAPAPVEAQADLPELPAVAPAGPPTATGAKGAKDSAAGAKGDARPATAPDADTAPDAPVPAPMPAATPPVSPAPAPTGQAPERSTPGPAAAPTPMPPAAPPG
jgi:uncharacterized membrane protein YgcG